MDTEVKKFIEDNAGLLEKDDLEQFYKSLKLKESLLGGLLKCS